jgi:hypothetical protein
VGVRKIVVVMGGHIDDMRLPDDIYMTNGGRFNRKTMGQR